MKIAVSTEWQEIRRQIKVELRTIGYNPDLDKMVNNVDLMVSALSKIEVVVRRSRGSALFIEKLSAINDAIDRIEKLMIMAKLMR